MRIIQLIQKPQLRGAELFACQLSNHLTQLGHEVIIVALFNGEGNLPWDGKFICLNRSIVLRLIDFVGWRQLDKLIKDLKPDIVQANAGDTLKYATLSKWIFRWNAPIVFRNASTISAYIKSPLALWLNTQLFKLTSYVISVSNHSKNDFVSLFPRVRNTIEVATIGIELNNEVSIKNERGYLLHVGGFTFEKNHEGLLRIFSRLVNNDPSLCLWLIGDGPLRSAIQKQVEELAIKDNVRFLGYQQNVTPYFDGARALLLPSLIEGLPAVILEAMHNKTPVVAYNVGGISEVVTNGETGFLIDSGDEAGFVEAAGKTLTVDINEIIERAYTLVVKEFDNRKIAKHFERIYEKVMLSVSP